MAIKLNESMALSAPVGSGSKWRVKVIEAGWGSSGYYGPEMLAQYGPQVFAKGTKVFMNHPSATESSDRPERDVHQLAGKLTSDAIFTENGLQADIEFYSHFAPIIKEMAGDVGLSIHALGEANVGEAEGRQGPIIEKLVADPLTSVDVVTVAGAGGKFLTLLESYTRKDADANPVSESVSEGNGMSITKEEFDAAIAGIKEAFVEAIKPVVESVSVLAEAAKPVEGEAAPVVEAADPVEIATKFNESGLPKVSLQRIAEALKADAEKSVDELISAEKAYVTAVSESAIATTDNVGVIHEAKASTTLVDEFDSIVARHVKKG
jgi:hypothetical protein